MATNPYNSMWTGPGNGPTGDQVSWLDEPTPDQLKKLGVSQSGSKPVSTTMPVTQPVLYGDPQTTVGATPAQTPQSAGKPGLPTTVGSTPAQTPQSAGPLGATVGSTPTQIPQTTSPQAGPGSNTNSQQNSSNSPWGDAGDYGSWIDQRLKETGNTTDDPNYWRTQMSKDPKAMAGDPSAIGWWKDAIDRAEGSQLVKSGQLSLRGTGGGSGNPGPGGFSMRPYQGGSGTLMNGALGVGDANSLYANLMNRANQSLNVDPRTDPIIRAQTDAFDAARQRGDRNTLSGIAEQAGANTNLEAIKRSAGEASGQATSSYQAGLAGNEIAARRQEVQQALSGALGLLTSQQQMALQEELSNLDRAQQQWQFEAGLGQNESQFARQLGQNAYQFDINDQFRNSPLAWA